jgi:hypothetical protein
MIKSLHNCIPGSESHKSKLDGCPFSATTPVASLRSIPARSPYFALWIFIDPPPRSEYSGFQNP